MTAADLIYPVLGQVALFICSLAVPLLGMSLLHMIGKSQ